MSSTCNCIPQIYMDVMDYPYIKNLMGPLWNFARGLNGPHKIGELIMYFNGGTLQILLGTLGNSNGWSQQKMFTESPVCTYLSDYKIFININIFYKKDSSNSILVYMAIWCLIGTNILGTDTMATSHVWFKTDLDKYGHCLAENDILIGDWKGENIE